MFPKHSCHYISVLSMDKIGSNNIRKNISSTLILILKIILSKMSNQDIQDSSHMMGKLVLKGDKTQIYKFRQ